LLAEFTLTSSLGTSLLLFSALESHQYNHNKTLYLQDEVLFLSGCTGLPLCSRSYRFWQSI
jgi:hypothetical protein